MQKKSSLTELFYLTLLITALRPPDNSLHYRRDRVWFGSSDTLGPILAEDICFSNANRFSNANGAFSTKNSILIDETHQALRYINSLGRLFQPAPYSSSLFAYPVSRGPESHVIENTSSFNDIDDIPHTSTPITSRIQSPASLLDDSDVPSDLLAELENFTPLDDLDLFDLNEDVFLDDGALFQDGNNNDVQEGPSTSDLFEQSLNVDELLEDNSVMFPTLDSNDGDVNDLFGELELFLSNETETYGPEWQGSTFYTPLHTGENGDYSVYESEPRAIENCAIFEPSNSNAQQVATNSSGSLSNGSNFGAVLYSSLTTLSNGNEPINGELAPPQAVYSSSEISDLAYMSNVSNLSINNVSTSDCFYNGYLPDEIPIAEVTAANNSQFSYEQQQQPAACYTPAASNHSAPNQFPTQTTEDCFDKSSDSAVSSMSSDRVHSFSDNDWAETSSESSYNGEISLSDYSNNENKCNNSAQKKYRLFGKNKNSDFKNSSQEYYIDYGHGNYVYQNSCLSSNENYDNQANYYASGIAHNHTYAQSAEMAPLSSVSANIPNSWNPSENSEANSVKKEANESTRSTKSSSKKQHNAEAHRDPHLNRDEKRARALKIPITTQDIINLPIDEFNERLTKYELTEMQLSLIRDIRRRGKNKVAAQNCRKRKLDQIMGLQTEVDTMFNQKGSLESQYNQLLMMREVARDKYTKLYQFVVEASASRQPFFDLTASPPGFPDKDSSQEVQLNGNGSNSFVVSSNITAAIPVTSFGVQNEFNKQN